MGIEFFRAAAALAGVGLKVFPIIPGERAPLIKEWPQRATDDHEVIAQWAREWPGANVAIACGPGSGVMVVDVDTKNGKDGRVALARLAREGKRLPPGPEARTPSGGLHLFFRHRAGPRNIVGLTADGRGLGIGIDIKTAGGFVMAAPSATAKGVYRWAAPPLAGTFPDLPPWALSMLLPRPATPVPPGAHDAPQSIDGLVRFVAQSPSGTRNGRLYWAAMTAREEPGAYSALLHAGLQCGLGEKEIRATLRSAKLRGGE